MNPTRASPKGGKSKGRSRALSFDDLERVMGVTSAAPAAGHAATQHGGTASGQSGIRLTAVQVPRKPAAKRAKTAPPPAMQSFEDLYIWEWELRPGSSPPVWQKFDGTLCHTLSRIKKNMQTGGYRSYSLQLDLFPGQPAIQFTIDVASLTFFDNTNRVSRRIRFTPFVEGAALIVPPNLMSLTYRLQFMGCRQRLALEVLQQPGVNLSDWDDVYSRMQRRIDEENTRSMDAAMAASRNQFEADSERQREQNKKKRLDVPPVQNPEYSESKLLAQCRESPVFVAWANADVARKNMVALLDLEKRCSKWYPTSSVYFTKVGKDFILCSSQGGVAAAQLQLMLEAKLQEVNKAVCAIPTDGVAGRVPQLFLDGATEVRDTDLRVISASAPGGSGKETIVLE